MSNKELQFYFKKLASSGSLSTKSISSYETSNSNSYTYEYLTFIAKYLKNTNKLGSLDDPILNFFLVKNETGYSGFSNIFDTNNKTNAKYTWTEKRKADNKTKFDSLEFNVSIILPDGKILYDDSLSIDTYAEFTGSSNAGNFNTLPGVMNALISPAGTSYDTYAGIFNDLVPTSYYSMRIGDLGNPKYIIRLSSKVV